MPSLDPLTPLYLPLRPHSKLPPPHSSPSKPSVRTPKTTTFERPLIDHLAEFLEGRDGRTIRSIREASGVERAEVVGAVGERRFRATGSASAVGKARGLVDARLSQTPIRILLALRLSDERSSIQFIPCPSPSPPLPPNSFCIVESDPLPRCLTPPPEPDGEGYHKTEFVGTPGSERSEGSFFASMSRASSSGESIKGHSLPSVGSFVGNRHAYVAAILEELEACVARSSLSRLKLFAGSQLFRSGGSQSPEPGERVSMEEASKWRIDGAGRNLSPFFSLALSLETAEAYKARLVDKMGLQLSHQTSHVHIIHLDRQRAVYAVATTELRGGELWNIPKGTAVSGTLVLKKVSTLPSKPFFLSITTPTRDGEPISEGSDLRIKVLADKAATSPSLELSAAVQRASWDLDEGGIFEVHIDLDASRFAECETEIRWVSKCRYENSTVRATVCEVREHGTNAHWYEFELTSKLLNRKLSDYVQARTPIVKAEVEKIASAFIDWGLEVVNGR